LPRRNRSTTFSRSLGDDFDRSITIWTGSAGRATLRC